RFHGLCERPAHAAIVHALEQPTREDGVARAEAREATQILEMKLQKVGEEVPRIELWSGLRRGGSPASGAPQAVEALEPVRQQIERGRARVLQCVPGCLRHDPRPLPFLTPLPRARRDELRE